MRIPLAVYCVIRRARPTNSKFHPGSGFIPTQADLVKKDCNFVSKLQSFFAGYSQERRYSASAYVSELPTPSANNRPSIRVLRELLERALAHQTKNLVTRTRFLFGGGSWIRTSEVSDNRFTVCPLWPLGNSPILSGAGGRT